ncbi:FAD-binding and (Fe-S)-binding domain-containing protein [Marinobacter orientalis]|uniref:D-lactate dehydrogenase (cytochrome) n=1 Tax=Marinobacter orientalis TaxID=1928859 RepID=A0A7Y0WRL8_9GAMM|nr:FAD-binding and (Fe-S)-binding domain-containing protein [Marinobacter orientalis]NMT63144.1 FAD-binding oxidoreductase [Marinobacter orientalis]TGX51801.1 FAD-binding oxidoreductase [Marinobacter orientalis]
MTLSPDALAAIKELIPATRVYDDPLSTLAYGTDASFYRLIPGAVVKVESEEEVVGILKLARRFAAPVTFRAAGTSLSGQAVSDSILLVLGDQWRDHEIRNRGRQIRLQPGIIGAQANAWLAPYGYKIGPDPASINACKIGGIVANNASGMCCGTAQNTYHTLASMRLVLADGAVVDTEDFASVKVFRASHAALLSELEQLAAQTRADTGLADRIRHKYRLKNTTGLSLNALVDYSDPLDILTHLMVGSEGTLGFVSSVTYNTVPDYPDKATALLVFADADSCCRAAALLRSQPVDAVELLDRRSLRSVENKPGLPEWIHGLSDDACALLIETRAPDQALLQEQLVRIRAALADFPLEEKVDFTTDPKVSELLWAIRKGTFPAVGAVRPVGTTVIIEDVTFPLDQLAEGVKRLQALFVKHGYDNAIIFGHALEGNLHFVFPQGFDDPDEVVRYDTFMKDVSQLVAVEFGGSLKAEHGTGRNMAPFVELEWGHDAWQLMWRIKGLLDPENLLNPDVVLSRDPDIHLKNLKPLPAADPLIDKCIECGFCEPVCPSEGLTLSPRQRIVIWRDIQARKRAGEDTSGLEAAYQYQGIDTCAATGLCARRCPVDINTGDLVRKLRAGKTGHHGTADWVANHFRAVLRGTRLVLTMASGAEKLLGAPRLARLSAGMSKVSGQRLPQWDPSMPQPIRFVPPSPAAAGDAPKVVYLPACVSRVMGPASGDAEQTTLQNKTRQLLEKGGYQVIHPQGLDALCCGQPFASKGYPQQADRKKKELLDALLAATRNGQDPVYCDTSPCTLQIQEAARELGLDLYDPVKFIREKLADRLVFKPEETAIAVHVTCSTQHLGESQGLIDIARRCSTNVVIPEDIHCCAFAGDKGFNVPELNSHALRTLPRQVDGCTEGISTSRTCEIGLSRHGGIDYHGLVYLVDRVTEAAAH